MITISKIEVPRIEMILTTKQVDKLSHVRFSLNFYTFDNVKVSPVSLYYGVYCKTNDSMVRNVTLVDIPVFGEGEYFGEYFGNNDIELEETDSLYYIILNSSDTRIINSANYFETKTITVSAGLPDGAFITNNWDIIIRNTMV